MSVNRNSVGPAWAPQRRFDRDGEVAGLVADAAPVRLKPGVADLIEAFRLQGHRFARLDPLGSLNPADAAGPAGVPALAQFGLTDDAPVAEEDRLVLGAQRALELHQRLRQWYCSSVAVDLSAVRDGTRRQWLQQRIETAVVGAAVGLPTPPEGLSAASAVPLLERLAGVEGWERFMARRYPHGKRFSLEGNEALVPLLDAMLARAAGRGVTRCVMGMPHRGRVNVLVNLLGHPVAEIMDYFEAAPAHPERQKDLVYHLGGRYAVATPSGAVAVTLASNPSHLQSVYPVVVGMARGTRVSRGSAQGLTQDQCLPVVMHGDAAFAGQGVVMETLALGLKPGYEVGGVIHIIINNQLGFTEPNRMDQQQARFCTDVTRMVDAPVLRVSADDPEAVQRIASLAVDYRARFGTDVVIDLIGYRRLGHSEHDEPMFTAPRLYRHLPSRPGVATAYAHSLVARGIVTAQRAEAALRPLELFDPAVLRTSGHREATPAVAGAANHAATSVVPPAVTAEVTAPTSAASLEPGIMPDVAHLRWVLANLADVPVGFEPHPVLARLAARWQRLASGESAAQGGPETLDWCTAESIAHALILSAGIPLRISGLDVQRGTFLHRHAVWHNQAELGMATWMPLSHFTGRAPLEVHNSILSEEAVLGFEYGHSVEAASAMTIWEAQFGDFVNGAQVFLDQYISSGEEKWGYASGLTVLLPHGYEGIGPEHSNGFLSRLLLLCGADNLRVAYPSTAAQWALLLLQQAMDPVKKPLVVMTPKAVLLNEVRSHVTVEALATARFQPVIDDTTEMRAQVQRVVLCSGKVYYDLLSAREALPKAESTRIALVRVERLYPFPAEELAAVMAAYPGATSVVWAQEETRNQGAWPFIRDDLQALLPASVQLVEVSRTVTAAGATASPVIHAQQQQALVARALGSAAAV
ncbi:2-oxoglutarate dehydrogenase E1 component [Roseateles sp. SL47]|uniref:2-oxoglutarate dehydrogenase E1 component n=1 Tax=Roseateles sp. SL47 TaxID=2995138 RepID=UPI002271063C|nr:2-oxoglutarate dehydrogenase E1 component [Roseateles sp. SL47]WAC72784.1 2-oxoglutarate dehydrogenase E1 component [Roseateles sp. SL47]